MKRTRRIAFDAVFTALALAVFVLESQIPIPLPLPGVKLGLSNVVTLFVMFALGPLDALAVLSLRVTLGSVFSGSLTAFLYSAVGGALCYAVTLMLHAVVSDKQVWVCGVFGAVAHVVGQMAVAVLLTQTPRLLYYMPILVLAALATGTLTGLVAQFVLQRTASLFGRRSKCGPKK